MTRLSLILRIANDRYRTLPSVSGMHDRLCASPQSNQTTSRTLSSPCSAARSRIAVQSGPSAPRPEERASSQSGPRAGTPRRPDTPHHPAATPTVRRTDRRRRCRTPRRAHRPKPPLQCRAGQVRRPHLAATRLHSKRQARRKRRVPVDRSDFSPCSVRMAVLVVAVGVDAHLPHRIRDVVRQPSVGEERTHILHPADFEEAAPTLCSPARAVSRAGRPLSSKTRRPIGSR